MRELYLKTSESVFFTAAMAVTVFYLDYYQKEVQVVDARDGIPWDAIDGDTRVYLAGNTPSPETFARLYDAAGDLVWIDNDLDAVLAVEERSSNERKYRRVKGLRKANRGLIELSWDSYFAWMKNPPRLIALVGRYEAGDDTQPNWESEIVPFNRAFAQMSIDPTDPDVFKEFWKEVVCIRRDPTHENEIIDGIIAKGREMQLAEGLALQ